MDKRKNKTRLNLKDMKKLSAFWIAAICIFALAAGVIVAVIIQNSKDSKEKDIIEISQNVTITDAVPQMIQIRYYNTSNPGVRKTTELFDINGKTLNQYRLSCDGMTGAALENYLKSTDFLERIPSWNPPPQFITVTDTIINEDGTYVIGTSQALNPEYNENYVEEYNERVMMFEVYLIENFTIEERRWWPVIPGGDGWVWESVDMTKPYKERYTVINSQEGLYDGTKWIISDLDLYERFSYWTCRNSNPIRFVSYRTIYYY